MVLGGDYVIRIDPSGMELAPLEKRLRDLTHPFHHGRGHKESTTFKKALTNRAGSLINGLSALAL